jgi:hypothetical protein
MKDAARLAVVRTRPTISKSDLGLAAIILGCVWTAAAFLVMIQAGPGRGRSLQTLLALACLVGTVSCAMLALAFFPGFVKRLRIAGWVTVIAAIALAVAVIWSAWELPPEELQWFANPGDARESENLAVNGSLVMLACSLSLITARLISNQASQHHFQPIGAVQAVFLLFWRQHKLVGWMALSLAVAHSAYFLRFPRDLEEQWTGIVALVLLGLLGLVGLFTSYRTRLALWSHRVIAVLLAVVLTLHWPPILYVEVGALLVLSVLTLLNLRLARLIVQHTPDGD